MTAFENTVRSNMRLSIEFSLDTRSLFVRFVLNASDVFLGWSILPLGAHFIGDSFIVANSVSNNMNSMRQPMKETKIE